MPIYEYKCNKCNTRFEILHIAKKEGDKVLCPICKSEDNKKLLSSFSSNVKSGEADFGHCCGENIQNGCQGCPAGKCAIN